MAYYHEDNANVHRGVHTLAERATVAYEASREKLSVSLSMLESTKEVLFYTWNDNRVLTAGRL